MASHYIYRNCAVGNCNRSATTFHRVSGPLMQRRRRAFAGPTAAATINFAQPPLSPESSGTQIEFECDDHDRPAFDLYPSGLTPGNLLPKLTAARDALAHVPPELRALGSFSSFAPLVTAALKMLEGQGTLVVVNKEGTSSTFAKMAKGLNCRQHQDPALLPPVWRTMQGADPRAAALLVDIVSQLPPPAAEEDAEYQLLCRHVQYALAETLQYAPASGGGACQLSPEQIVRLEEAAARCCGSNGGVFRLPPGAKLALRQHLQTCAVSAEQARRLLAAWCSGGDGGRRARCAPHDLRALLVCARLSSLPETEQADVLAMVVQLSPTYDLAPHLLSAAASVVRRMDLPGTWGLSRTQAHELLNRLSAVAASRGAALAQRLERHVAALLAADGYGSAAAAAPVLA